MIDPRLQNHPVIRAEAERLAREWNAVLVTLPTEYLWNACMPKITMVESFIRLLSDPSRPETRDYLVRSGNARVVELAGDPLFDEIRDDNEEVLVFCWLGVYNA